MKADDKRVLSRTGARELTPHELETSKRQWAAKHNVITFNPSTGQRDARWLTKEKTRK